MRRDAIQERDMLPGKEVKLLTLGQYKATVPLAGIELKWEGLRSTLKVGIHKNLPADALAGNDILSLLKVVQTATCSKRENLPEFTVVTSEDGKAAEMEEAPVPLSAGNSNMTKGRGRRNLQPRQRQQMEFSAE